MVLKNAICCSYFTTFATTSPEQRLKNKFNSIFPIELFKPQTKLKLNDTFLGYIFGNLNAIQIFSILEF